MPCFAHNWQLSLLSSVALICVGMWLLQTFEEHQLLLFKYSSLWLLT